MNLSQYGREYAHWPYTADAALNSADVNIDDTWYPAALVDNFPAAGTVTLLLAGTKAVGDDAVVLGIGTHTCQIRFNDNPELVVRDAGTIVVS